MSLLMDPHIWLVFSFLIVVYIIWHYGKKPILSYIDGRIESIRSEIEIAENLRIEAQEMLAQYQRKQRDAENEAKRIIDNAKKSAKQFQEKAEQDIKETMDRREKQLQERLERMKSDAIQEIQTHTAQLAMKAAKEIIIEKLDKKTYDNLVEKSVSNIEQQSKILN